MRIALVNDMVAALEAMRRVILGKTQHEIAWVARDGTEALELCSHDTPDLILMDLLMPHMDGVEATRRIMARQPCAIVVVTASVNRLAARVFEAMGAGALDAVNTPTLEHTATGAGARALLAKIETIRRLIRADSAGTHTARAPAEGHHSDQQHKPLIAIGASAGGPAALATILARLPEDFPAPVIIVQHVDPHFARGLADWLNGQTALHVRLARDGDRPQAGTALLAGHDKHLAFANPRRLVYTTQPVDCSYRPSVDVFFKSAGQFWPGDVIGVLLTGMGRDGAEGLRVLHAGGHHTIAQDRLSSAVYGMPGAAAELDAATEILALDKIGPRLSNIVAHRVKAHG
jgi:two-component system, chemotaxis family, response regulator WspF